ncbi:MAG: BON domain-containing protein [Alphaproteobacteria bacterium]
MIKRPTKNLYRTAAACLIAILPLAGCTPVGMAVGAGATAGSAAMQERGFEQSVRDSVTEAAISKALFDRDLNVFANLNVEVVEGRVLLTGFVPTQEDRLAAVRYSWERDEVTDVINEIQIGDSEAITSKARDKLIASEIRADITIDEKIKAVNYSIEVVNGTVYLFGIAQNQQELDRVVAHARKVEYVRRIVTDHMVMKDDPRRKSST